jgi:hypothetical protein
MRRLQCFTAIIANSLGAKMDDPSIGARFALGKYLLHRVESAVALEYVLTRETY